MAKYRHGINCTVKAFVPCYRLFVDRTNYLPGDHKKITKLTLSRQEKRLVTNSVVGKVKFPVFSLKTVLTVLFYVATVFRLHRSDFTNNNKEIHLPLSYSFLDVWLEVG